MYYFIVNPGSRSGNGKYVWQAVRQALQQEQAEYRVFFTSHRYHASEIARELTSGGKRLTLVAVGGDGTVNEVINGIQDFSRVTFAYIPTGSSNDFARSQGLPSDPVQALQNILHPAYFRKIDLGLAATKERSWYFAVSCGCGFDAAVCQEALNSRIKKLFNRLRLGKLTYAGIALKQILMFRPFGLTLTLDKKERLHFTKAFFLSVMNCPYEGGGLKLAPEARTDDGLLNPCAIANISRGKIALLFPSAFLGWHTHIRGVYLHRAASLKLLPDAPVPFHTDGETTLVQGPISVTCIPEALTIISSN